MLALTLIKVVQGLQEILHIKVIKGPGVGEEDIEEDMEMLILGNV